MILKFLNQVKTHTKLFVSRTKRYFVKKINVLENYFFKSKIVYVSEKAGWVINEIGKCIKNDIGDEFKISLTHIGIRKSIIHFGSVNTILTESGVVYPHKSNKIIVTCYHIVQNNRLEYFKELSKIVDLWITSSSITKNELVKLGVLSKKIRIIPLGVDLSSFNPPTITSKNLIRKRLGIPKQSFVIGSFQKDGNGWGKGLEPKLIKGPDIFCEIASLLSKEIEFSVLLTGPSRGYVKRKLMDNNINFKHCFLENYREISDYYKAIDLYIISSRIEGGPMALMESMASGVPVISTKVGMAFDLIDDKKNGRFFDPKDLNNVVKIIKSIYNNKKLKEKYVENGLNTVKNYDWKIISNKMLSAYQLFYDD